jgi:hypothetical protein
MHRTALVSAALLVVAACESPIRPTPAQPTPTQSAPVPVTPAPQGLVDLSGDYILTFQVGSGCEEVPKELRTRTYEARIRWDHWFGSSVYFLADLSGADFHDDQQPVSIEVTENSVGVDLSDNVILEEPSPGAYLATSGYGVASVQSTELSTISGPFTGYFKYCAAPSGAGGTDRCSVVTMTQDMCKAENSRWTLTRR